MMLDRLTVEKTIFNLKYGVYWLRIFFNFTSNNRASKTSERKTDCKISKFGFFQFFSSPSFRKFFDLLI